MGLPGGIGRGRGSRLGLGMGMRRLGELRGRERVLGFAASVLLLEVQWEGLRSGSGSGRLDFHR